MDITALKKVLFDRNIKQVEVSSATGIRQSAVSNIVNGWEKPTADQREKIAKYLKMDPNELFGEV